MCLLPCAPGVIKESIMVDEQNLSDSLPQLQELLSSCTLLYQAVSSVTEYCFTASAFCIVLREIYCYIQSDAEKEHQGSTIRAKAKECRKDNVAP